jgi:hypothetical protein
MGIKQGDCTLYSDKFTMSGKMDKDNFDGEWTIKYKNGKVETGYFR